MAEKNLDKKSILDGVASAALAFNQATFELGLKLIDDYRTGNCQDRNKTLDAIIQIFTVQPLRGTPRN